MENINKALAQLEDSLNKIDSARSQVEKVTENGSKLSLSTLKLAEEVKSIADIIKSETSAIIQQFSSSLKSFDQRIIETSEKNHRGISEGIENLKTVVDNIKQAGDSHINEVKTLSIETIKRQESETLKNLINTTKVIENDTTAVISRFSKNVQSFEESIESIKEKSQGFILLEVEKLKHIIAKLDTTSTKSINEVKLLSLTTIQEQEALNTKAIESILLYSNQIQDLVKQISEMELPNKLTLLEKEIYQLQINVKAIQEQIITHEQTIVNTIQSQVDQINNKLLENAQSTKKTRTILTISLSVIVVLLLVIIFK